MSGFARILRDDLRALYQSGDHVLASVYLYVQDRAMPRNNFSIRVSQRELARAVRISREQARRALRRLEFIGLITVQVMLDQTTIKVVNSGSKIDALYPQKNDTPAKNVIQVADNKKKFESNDAAFRPPTTQQNQNCNPTLKTKSTTEHISEILKTLRGV